MRPLASKTPSLTNNRKALTRNLWLSNRTTFQSCLLRLALTAVFTTQEPLSSAKNVRNGFAMARATKTTSMEAISYGIWLSQITRKSFYTQRAHSKTHHSNATCADQRTCSCLATSQPRLRRASSCYAESHAWASSHSRMTTTSISTTGNPWSKTSSCRPG